MNDTTLIIKRTFDASPEQVFEAWIDPVQVAKWYGPEGVDAEIHEMDAVEGGKYSLTMVTPKGKHPLSGTFKTIDKPSKLVFTWQWGETEMLKDWTNETLVTVELKEVDGKTEMTMTHSDLFDESAKTEHGKGWSSSFDKLEQHISN